ncbi:MAG TPA: discoidin domain-containing protein [Vicinamibacterales bacterium]|nr:discoidin domain-containing protein [Vicinamibacterales bacterium]
MKRPLAASALAYVALTAITGRHVLAAIGTSIASDPGDPLLTTAILSWNATHVPWTGAWYQFPIFWPTRDVLVFSEHLLGVSVIAAPIQWLTGNPIAAYNLTVLLSYPLSGLAMYLLICRLTRSSGAAFLAGLAYAFVPFRTSHLPHIQILVSFWMPLSLLGLHAYLESRRWPWLALFALTWALQGAANGYALVYFSFMVGLWVAWFMAARGRWRDVGAVAAALVAAALPLAPILYRYLTAQRALGLTRGLGEIADYSADIAAPLCAPPALTFWGWLRVACAPEGELFVGGALIALCVAGAIAGKGLWGGLPVAGDPPARWRVLMRRTALGIALMYGAITLWTIVFGPWRVDFPFRASASSADKPATVTLVLLLVALLLSDWFRRLVQRGSTATFYMLCAVVCWVLAWGPFPRFFGERVLYQAPYGWLMALPGFSALRVPARLWLIVIVCLTVFMGLAVARLLAGRTARATRLILTVAALALAADGWTTIPTAAVPQPVSGLADRTVLRLPVGEILGDIESVYHAVTQNYRAINGYSGYFPPYYEALGALSQARDERMFGPFLSRGSIDVLTRPDDVRSRVMVERQPGAMLVSEGVLAHYRVPARDVPPIRTDPAGRPVPIGSVRSECSPERVGLMTDRNPQTGWVCGVQEPVQDITIDLGAVTEVGAIVQTIGSNGAFFPRQLRIETSLDERSWLNAWEGSPAAEVLYAAMARPRESRTVIEFAPRPARFVRLTQVARGGTYVWSIAELEVFSGP